MKIHIIQHVPFEGPGNIEKFAGESSHKLSVTRLYENETLPELYEIDLLVVMGGPMNIYEENKYPWLVEEKRFIEKAVKSGKKVLGICLGAQIIADVLGAKVYKGEHREIGWFPVELDTRCKFFKNMPENINVFHWHGDTFDIPERAIRIVSGKACKNQGFLYGKNVAAFQFHLETNLDSAKKLICNCRDEIVPGEYIQTEETMLSSEDKFLNLEKYLNIFLENFLSESLNA